MLPSRWIIKRLFTKSRAEKAQDMGQYKWRGITSPKAEGSRGQAVTRTQKAFL